MDIQRQTHNIEIYRGDTISETLIVVDSDDVSVDLTGCTVEGEIRRALNGEVVLALDVTITTPGNGVVDILTDTPEEDLDLGADGVGVWDLQITDADDHRYTSHSGSVTFVEDVTEIVSPI